MYEPGREAPSGKLVTLEDSSATLTDIRKKRRHRTVALDPSLSVCKSVGS